MTTTTTTRGTCLHCQQRKADHVAKRGMLLCVDGRHTYASAAASTAAPKYRPTICRNCREDVKGIYGSDRKAHTDGWCTDL